MRLAFAVCTSDSVLNNACIASGNGFPIEVLDRVAPGARSERSPLFLVGDEPLNLFLPVRRVFRRGKDAVLPVRKSVFESLEA